MSRIGDAVLNACRAHRKAAKATNPTVTTFTMVMRSRETIRTSTITATVSASTRRVPAVEQRGGSESS